MVAHDDNMDAIETLMSSLQTKPSMGKIPPSLNVATGHEDEVLLFFVHIDDADSTIDVLRRILRVSETNSILTTMARTGGLINKRFPIDQANRIKQKLEMAGTIVEFIRPDDGEEIAKSREPSN